MALSIGAQTAMAEAQAQRIDPKAESPAGVIYQIPLDSARRDAAPVLPTGSHGGGSGGPGSSAGGGPGSGTGGQAGSTGGGGSASGSGGTGGSSRVASGHSAGSGAILSASASEGGGTPQDPSSIHSENGFGSSQVPGVSQAALRTGAGVPATQTAGSTLPTYLLIVLIALVAVGMGVLATRGSGRRGGGQSPTDF